MAEPDGREYRELLLRLLDGVREDIVALRSDQGNTDAVARDALGKVEAMKVTLQEVRDESRASTITLVEMKAAARWAGAVTGTVVGALVSLLVAWLLEVLGVT